MGFRRKEGSKKAPKPRKMVCFKLDWRSGWRNSRMRRVDWDFERLSWFFGPERKFQSIRMVSFESGKTGVKIILVDFRVRSSNFFLNIIYNFPKQNLKLIFPSSFFVTFNFKPFFLSIRTSFPFHLPFFFSKNNIKIYMPNKNNGFVRVKKNRWRSINLANEGRGERRKSKQENR